MLGDASTVEGVAAPYDEEDTHQVAHLEPLIDQDVFTFWLTHQNRDLVTGRAFELRRLEPLAGDEGGVDQFICPMRVSRGAGDGLLRSDGSINAPGGPAKTDVGRPGMDLVIATDGLALA